VTRPTVRHYLGFARGRRERLREPDATVKHLLYAYRVLLSGIHAMRTGEVVADLPSLAEAVPDAQAKSALPEEPTTTAALEDLVIRLRLSTAETLAR
jgi:hypothetical protein